MQGRNRGDPGRRRRAAPSRTRCCSTATELRTAKVPTARRQEESRARGSRGGRRRASSSASRTARRSRRTRCSNGAARARRSLRRTGFEHLLHLRRQDARAPVPALCDHHPEPLVPLERCVGVRGRIGPDGERRAARPRRRSPSSAMRRRSPSACSSPSAIPSHERAVADGAAPSPSGRARRRVARGRRRSSASTSAPRRPRRTPTSGRSLGALPARARRARAAEAGPAGAARDALVGRRRRRSSEAAAHAALALLSGPAGGVVGAAQVARARRLRGRDLRSTWAAPRRTSALIVGRRGDALERAARRRPADPAARRWTSHTVGAGGGSIVRLDDGGALRVGPESAGADPGPACYGRGGDACRP